MIWIILIITLMKQTRLEVLGTNVLGLAFLCIYGLIIVLNPTLAPSRDVFPCDCAHTVEAWSAAYVVGI